MPVSIPLTRGQFALVDAEDADRVAAFKWCATPRSRKGSFIATRKRRKSEPGSAQRVTMHSFVFGETGGLEIDHINRDPLDNRRANLRLATRQENSANRAPWGGSGFKGVAQEASGKWVAHIRINGVKQRLGLFATAQEAARQYDRAANDAWGDYAFANLSGEAA